MIYLNGQRDDRGAWRNRGGDSRRWSGECVGRVARYKVGESTELDWKFLNGSRTVPSAGVTEATVPVTAGAGPVAILIEHWSTDEETIGSISTVSGLTESSLSACPHPPSTARIGLARL